MTQEDKETLLSFLGPHYSFNFMGSSRNSTLIAGLRDCRTYTKRNVDTGEYNPNIKHGDEGNWLGAIGYFTILNQIGNCYKQKGKPDPKGKANSISFAIDNFGYDLINGLSEINALTAFRNAFTHDFNLLNIPSNTRLVNVQQHKFTVLADTHNNWIIRLPRRLWDGNIKQKNFMDESDSTFVNLFGFGELVETIYLRVLEGVKHDQIEIRMPILELINKYTFVTSYHPVY